MDVEFYTDDDADWIYASVDRSGIGGLLRLPVDNSKFGDWVWIARGTEHWDAVHQKIFRNSRASKMGVLESSRLPPLPDLNSEPVAIKQAKYVANANNFPALVEHLDRQPDQNLGFCVVLYEDTYESSCGDGEFHYFHSVFRSIAEAESVIAADGKETYSKFHLRRLLLELSGNIIRYDLETKVFDHCDSESLFKAIEKLIVHSIAKSV